LGDQEEEDVIFAHSNKSLNFSILGDQMQMQIKEQL